MRSRQAPPSFRPYAGFAGRALLIAWCMAVAAWAADVPVPMPVPPGSTVVIGDTVTMPSGVVQNGADLLIVHNVKTVLQPGLAVQAGAVLRIRNNSTAPTITDISDRSILEDGTTGSIAFTIGDAETPATLLGVTGTSSNTAVVPNGNIVFSGTGANRTVTVTPAANQSGTATITVTVTDTGRTSIDVFELTVTPVNDVPSFTQGSNQTVLEDAAPQSVANWATAISAGPSDAGQTVAFTTTAVGTPALFSVQPSVSPTGTLTYTVAPNQYGSSTVSIRLSDNGGTANGGVDTSAIQTFTITVTPVNDVPSFTKGSDQTILEDAAPQSIANWATGIGVGTGDTGQTVIFSITAVSNSALFSVQPSVSPAGMLSYTLALNQHGSSTVSIRLSDNGGTANGGVDTSAIQTFTITVTPVNDAPSFTKGSDQTILEDAAPQSIANWATAISTGPSDTGQTVAFTTTAVGTPALFSVQPLVSPTGTLTYTVAPNQYGSSTVSIRLSDNGGTANGGIDTSAIQTFTINVTAVNDQPVASPGSLTVLEDSAAQPVTLSATDIEGDLLTYAIGTPPTKGTLSGTGANRTYTPSADATGSDSFTFTASDAGGPSAAATVSITITPVNDAPSFTLLPSLSVVDNLPVGNSTVIGNLSRGPADESAQTLSFLACTGFNANLFSVPPTVTLNGSTATLAFTPTAGVFGTTTVTINLSDNGGTANGGQDTASRSIAIFIQDHEWFALPTHTIYVVDTETTYPVETTDLNDPDRQVVDHDYEWFPGTNEVSRKTTTLPVVTMATNGPDSASTVDVTYDLAGRMTWLKDADGYVHYRAYDAFSGAVTVAIDDANTALTADFTSTPPYATPTTVQNPVAGGTHLKTLSEVDLLGRATKVTDPKGSITYTVFNDVTHEVRVYPGWDTASGAPTGPTRLAREDWGRDYREVLTMNALPILANSRPTGTEAISGVQSLRREILDGNGRVAAVDTYVDLTGITYSAASQTLGSQRAWVAPPATPSGAYERETFSYATRGFPERHVRADGTIERLVTDVLGRTVQRWRGTDDTGWTAGQTSDLTAFKQVGETVYDGGAVGLGLVTLDRTIGDDAAGTARVNYDTTALYDGRGRMTRSLGPDGVLTTLTVDNFGRTTLAETWAGVAVVTATPPASALRGRVSTSYDALSRAWRSGVTEVQGADGASPGTAGDTLYTQRWFDRRGYTVKRQAGTAGGFAKARIDGAGRTVYAWTGIDASETAAWNDARSSTGDTVAEATLNHLDAADNVVATTRLLRPDGASGSGDLTPGIAHRSVQVRWFDKAHRPIGMADFGKDDGTTRYVWDSNGSLIASGGLPAEALTPRTPDSSDDYRVTSQTYDAAGRPWQSTDNRGRISEALYDAAGRPVKTIANRVDGTAGAGETATDQTTVFVQAVGGGIAERKALVGTGSAVAEQVTRYLRQSTLDRSWVTAVIYPDSNETAGGGSNQVQTTYDRLGRPRTRTDQRAVVRTFGYDSAGRLATDAVTSLPAGVDGAVRRLQRGYDDLGRLRSRSSWNAASGGTQLDEVRRSFDGWGNINATAQAHDGAVTIGVSPTVSYTWDDGASGGIARSVRLTGVTYPSATHGVTYRYPASGLGAGFDRPEAIVSGGNDILTAEYLGVATLARQALPRAGATLERSAGGGAGGYSRYWQVASHSWTVNGVAADGWNFTFDRGGRITAKRATWGTSRTDRDDVMTYDDLHRLTSFKRGQAAADGSLADNATQRDWTWALDHAGNWRTFGQDSNGGAGAGGTTTQARSHNLANEIDTDDDHSNAAGTSISGTGVDWIDPVYDAAGAMTKIPMPWMWDGAWMTLTWDAWGRLVAANSPATVWTARYDAEHRRIRSVDVGASATSDYYLDESGREVEVRVGGIIAAVHVWGSGDTLLRVGTGSGGSITAYFAVLSDQQGSVTALVQDGTSTVVERYRYDAYGGRSVYDPDGVTPRVGTHHGMYYGYTGRPFDNVTGLGYYRYRWYHSSLGRFISRDPAGYIDGGNLYQYVRGNPLWWTDPYGLSPSLLSRMWDWTSNEASTWAYAGRGMVGLGNDGDAGAMWGAAGRGASRGATSALNGVTFGQVDIVSQAAQMNLQEARENGDTLAQVGYGMGHAGGGGLTLAAGAGAIQLGLGATGASAALAADPVFAAAAEPLALAARALGAGLGGMQVGSGVNDAMNGDAYGAANRITSGGMAIVGSASDPCPFNVAGRPGPGVTSAHLRGVQGLANETGVPIVVHGSRQTGVSVHTGLPFRPTSDLDLGVVGGPDEIMRALGGGWSRIPGVEHAPMRLVPSVQDAVRNGMIVVSPR